MPEIRIDFRIDDKIRDVVALVKRLADVLVLPAMAEPWIIDATKAHYLGPDASVILAAVHARERGLHHNPVRVLLPSQPPALAGFCQFSGMLQLFQNGARPDLDHPECETVPLTTFTSVSANIADPVVKLIQRHVELAEDAEEYLRICLTEVAQNVVDHAESPIGGIWCARFFKSRNQVRVALADAGLGIFKTLRRQFPELDGAEDAMRRVLRGNASSRSRPNNMGQGINNLGLFIRRCRGSLILMSGDAACEVRHDRSEPWFAPGQFSWPGTAVFFTLPTSVPDE